MATTVVEIDAALAEVDRIGKEIISLLNPVTTNLRTFSTGNPNAQTTIDQGNSAIQQALARLDELAKAQTVLLGLYDSAPESVRNETRGVTQTGRQVVEYVSSNFRDVRRKLAEAEYQLQSSNAPAESTVSATSSTVTTTLADGTQRTTSSNSTSTSVTNPSASDAASAEKMANPQNIVGGDTLEEVQVTATRIPADAKASANPANVAPAFAKFKNGDKRVRLIVPPSYLIGPAAGPPPAKTTGQGVLQLNGGIVFPYLPQINIEYSSNWTENQALHSNYKQYFFKTSSPGEIGLVAKFSVQNSFDAATLLAIQHLLRALIKMPFGSDPNAGSPPPICRLLAHGDYMLDGVPVAIKNFKLDYPSDVDYFTLDKDLGYGVTSVPVVTSLNLTLIPVYSRNEMLNASTTGWLIGGQRIQGYL